MILRVFTSVGTRFYYPQNDFYSRRRDFVFSFHECRNMLLLFTKIVFHPHERDLYSLHECRNALLLFAKYFHPCWCDFRSFRECSNVLLLFTKQPSSRADAFPGVLTSVGTRFHYSQKRFSSRGDTFNNIIRTGVGIARRRRKFFTILPFKIQSKQCF